MRFDPLVTVMPLDLAIEYDQGLQHHLRDTHARQIGEAMIRLFGVYAGESETGEDFILNRRSVWLRTDFMLPTAQEVAALHRLHVAALYYVRNGEGDAEIEAALTAFKQRLLEDAAEQIIEEQSEGEGLERDIEG